MYQGCRDARLAALCVHKWLVGQGVANMPKKSTPARNGVQRTKPKTQKSFELVRPTSQVQELEDEEIVTMPEETSPATRSTATIEAESSSDLDALPTVPNKRVRSSNVATEVAPARSVPAKATKKTLEEPVAATSKESEEMPIAVVPKGSAAARIAANKAVQRTKRSSASLITAEHYSYVRRDLMFIAVLAVIMFAAIIILYFTGVAA